MAEDDKADARSRSGEIADSAEFGAPRSMKIGTIRSPCPYDAAARHALQSANLRQPAKELVVFGCDIAFQGGAPALMKLITTFPLELYDISAFGLRAPSRASGASQSYYD